MGLPARKIDTRSARPRPELRLVKASGRRRSSTTQRVRARTPHAYREGFALCCVLMCGVALFGLARVMLAAQATEASLDSGTLRAEIKAERLTGDLLEVDRSALTVPSRIENIAGTSMKMAEAGSVEYLTLPLEVAQSVPPTGTAEVTQASGDVSSGSTGLFASILDMAAGEAQVLLVGDLGLASSK